MNLNHIRIQNYKSIADMELRLEPGVNLLIGDNGVGKTSVLEALTVGLSACFQGFQGIRGRGILQHDVRFETSLLGDASSNRHYHVPVEIECSVDVEGTSYEWVRSRKDESGAARTTTSGNHPSIELRNRIDDSDVVLPILSYHSTTRLANSRRGDYAETIKKMNDRRAGYLSCLDDSLDSKAINAWCFKMEMAEFKLKRSIQEYETFKRTVQDFMAEMEENLDLPMLSYDTNFNELAYGNGNSAYPISCLSAGYQSVLWIIMDLAYRNALLNPTMEDSRDARGIVMIDEIDMHLHPKWQWKVIPALEKVFPGVQFILATHSPIIISSCKNAHLALIQEDHIVSYETGTYAYSIQDVVELVQGSDAVPGVLRKLASDFDVALNAADYDSAQHILNAMREQFGPDNSEVKSAAFELSVETGED